MGVPTLQFDGNWVDCGSVVTGLLYLAFRTFRLRGKRKFVSKWSALDFANGIALFPQLLLIFCVFSTDIVEGLLAASKISLCIAGGFALMASLDDPIEPAKPADANVSGATTTPSPPNAPRSTS